MQSRTLVENLLNKYLLGNLTSSESRQLNELLADPEKEPIFREILFNHINEFTDESSSFPKNEDPDLMYEKILARIKPVSFQPSSAHKTSLLKRVFYFSSAAAILVFVFFLGRISQVESPDLISSPVSFYTEVNSPYGSRSEVKLPDGTNVILNAGSTIHYSNDFNLSNRDLDLNGEAYFKVAKNPGLPFVVSAGEVEIIATGTEFNVKAYPEESTVETTLIEGAVEITNSNAERKGAGFIDLIPNQKAIFYKGEERYHLENIEKKIVKPEPVETFLEKVMISPKTDVEKTVAWTQGKLIFRGETLENMCVDLQRKYNVNFFFIEEDLKNYRFTGILLDETLEQVLEVIKLAAPVDFTIEGKTVYLLTDVKQLDGYRKELK